MYNNNLFKWTLLIFGICLINVSLCMAAATSQGTENAGVPGINSLPGIEISPEQMKKYFPAPLGGSAKKIDVNSHALPHVPVLSATPVTPVTPITPLNPITTQNIDNKNNTQINPHVSDIPNIPEHSSKVPFFLNKPQTNDIEKIIIPENNADSVKQAIPNQNQQKQPDINTLRRNLQMPQLPKANAKNAFIPIQANNMQDKSPTLEFMLGQMVMAGFSGADLEKDSQILKLIKQNKLGGVLLQAIPSRQSNIHLPLSMSQNHTANIPSSQGNISSPMQVRQLTATLQRAVSIDKPQLWIAVEQEGGNVQSLRKDLGFEGLAAAAHLGQGTIENTEIAARRAGLEMASIGINFVLGPAADVNVNPLSENIGKRFRSFGANPKLVAAHVLAFSRGLLATKVLPCVRNFPGTGSTVQNFAMPTSTAPNFLQTIPDLAISWQNSELIPYQQGIANQVTVAMQPALVYHRTMDALAPVPLSVAALNGVLRNQLNFKGLIVSPDLRSLQPFYTLEESILQAITAGSDILLISEPAVNPAIQNSGLNMANINDNNAAQALLNQGLGLLKGQDQDLLTLMHDAEGKNTVDQNLLSKSLLQNNLGKMLGTGLQAQLQPKASTGIATKAEAVYSTLLHLVKSGRISEKRVQESWQRIYAAKKALDLIK